MSRKYTLTPFARLFLFLIFFVPVGYFGFKIYNGEMSFEDLKNKVNFEKSASTSASDGLPTKPQLDDQCDEILKLKDREIQILKERIEALEGN